MHYSKAQHPKSLMKWAMKAADQVVMKVEQTGRYPVLCYQGMSGVASATALSIAIHQKWSDFEFGMVYVRKAEEKHHGSPVEDERADTDTVGQKNVLLFFVDDFVDEGHTYKRVIKHTTEYLRSRLRVPAGTRNFFRNVKMLSGSRWS